MMEDYQKEKLLCSGYFGSTWLVKSIQTRISYVMKKTKMNLLNEADRNNAFNEAKILSECDHKNIIRYKDTIIEHAAARLSIIIEYADGGDLSTAIQKQHGVPFSENKTLTWFIQICLALKYLHFRNILHRDLRPTNIYLTRNKTIKLCGFESAKILKDSMDVATVTTGKLHYRSPESIMKQPYNCKHDMWALGCILFEIFSLKRCFQDHHFLNLENVILEKKWTEFPHWCSSLEKEIVQDLLRYDPNLRPSADETLEHPLLKPYLSKYLLQASQEFDSLKVKIIQAPSSRVLKNIQDFVGDGAASESNLNKPLESSERSEVVERNTKLTSSVAPAVEFRHAESKRIQSWDSRCTSSLREVNLKVPLKTSKNRNLPKREYNIEFEYLEAKESSKNKYTVNSQPEVQSKNMHTTKYNDANYNRVEGILCISNEKKNTANLIQHINEQSSNKREMFAGKTMKGVNNISLGFDTAKFETFPCKGKQNKDFNCEHSRCSQCIIDMLWKNRMRGCIETNFNQSEYLKLKDNLSLVFENDLFQEVYQSLSCEWYGREIDESRFSINSFVKTLNYDQVQHLPLMMQLIQIDLLKKQWREGRKSTSDVFT